MSILEKIKNNRILNSKSFEILIFIVLALYPLRFAGVGCDLWDIGFNCVSFKYGDVDHMSRVLYYGYFLSVKLGHLLTMLPLGNTLVGIKAYCGLVISIDVVLSSVFCIRKLKINKWFVFLGEILSVSVCYSPSVVLYNHVSFLLLIVSIMLIYVGLTEQKTYCLVLAGACLGINIFFRFPNAIEPMLILAVWYYLFLNKAPIKEYLTKTLSCLLGYLVAIGAVIIPINSKYGINAYIDGIRDLFAISDDAAVYSPFAMITEGLKGYLRGARRIADVVIFAAIGCLIYLIIIKVNLTKTSKSSGINKKLIAIISSLTGMVLVGFMIVRKLMMFDGYHYAVIYFTVAFFAVLTIAVAVYTIVNRKSSQNEKLFSLLIILNIMIQSVGSGTGIAPVINSLFLVMPYFVYSYFKLITGIVKKCDFDKILITGCKLIVINVFSAVFFAFFLQCVYFGLNYNYEEAKGNIATEGIVTDSAVLKGTRMSAERAAWMQSLSDYLNENNLKGQGGIVYGYAPALLYYLELEPLISSWPDLESYSYEEMKKDLFNAKDRINEGAINYPVIILDNSQLQGVKEGNEQKWQLIDDFMNEYDYSESFSNERFSLWTAKDCK